MKKFRLFVCAVAALLLGVQSAGAAEFPVGKKFSDLGSKQFYIYNVGTGEYISAGGHWGTEAYTSDEGNLFTVSGELTEAKITAVGLGVLAPATDTRCVKDGHTFLDTDRSSTFTITEVTKDGLSVATGSTVYAIKHNHGNVESGSNSYDYSGYLTAAGTNKAVTQVTLDSDKDASSLDETSLWMFVTYEDVQSHFKNVAAATKVGGTPADGTFVIKDAKFERNNSDISNWKYGSYGRSLSNSNANVTPSTQTSTYYVGNGYTQKGTDENAKISSSSATTSDYTRWSGDDDDSYNADYAPKHSNSQRQFGGLWTANIHGASGKIYQTVTLSSDGASGWYIISCDGFTTTEGTAKLFASTGSNPSTTDNTYSSTELTYVETAPTTYAKAGALLQTENYNSSVMIYVEAGQQITFGVEVSGGSSDSWACLDNFELKYAGGVKDVYLILSDQETSVGYINAQVDPNKSYTLVLDRDLKAGQWNSFILPIQMTAQQFKLAFGSNAKISKISGLTGGKDRYTLSFTSVDIENDNNVAVEPGTLYIVRPTIAPSYTQGKEYTIYTRDYADGATTPTYNEYKENGEVKTVTTKNDYYLINQMALTEELSTTTGIVEQTDVPGADLANSLTFKGTYTHQTSETTIPVNSFVIGSDGKWYFTQEKTYPVKGFRTWIETTNSSEVNEMTFSVDGVEEGTVTAIRGIENDMNLNETLQNNKVYNMNGQLVRSGNTSLEGLAKGIYIVNGKKYIVK